MKTMFGSNQEPEFKVVVITPEMAKNILDNNLHNRSINARSVERLALAIEAGEWVFNGQPIQISTDGMLLDGQHRLLACVKANMPIRSLVIWNADAESQETMDMGKARSVADILRLRGFKNEKTVAALARRIALSETYGFKHGIVNLFREVTPATIVRVAENIEGLSRYTTGQAKAVGKVLNFPTGIVGFLMWTFDQIDKEDSEFFWDKLLTGDGLQQGHPIYALRYFALTRDSKNRGSQHYVLTSAGAILKAWNKYRLGESTERIYFRIGGARGEDLPTAV